MKVTFGIALRPELAHKLGVWTLQMRLSGQNANRGLVVEKMIEVLSLADWLPGDLVAKQKAPAALLRARRGSIKRSDLSSGKTDKSL